MTKNAKSSFLLKSLVVTVVFLSAGTVALREFGSIVLKKRFGNVELEQVTNLPSTWLPHELNPTYGYGGNPETEKYYKTHNAQGLK